MIRKFKSLWAGKPIWARVGIILTFLVANYLLRTPTIALLQQMTNPSGSDAIFRRVLDGVVFMTWIGLLNGGALLWLSSFTTLNDNSRGLYKDEKSDQWIGKLYFLGFACAVMCFVFYAIYDYTLILQENIVLFLFLTLFFPSIVNGIRTDVKANNLSLVCGKWLFESAVIIAFLTFLSNPLLNILKTATLFPQFDLSLSFVSEHIINGYARVGAYVAVIVAFGEYLKSRIRGGWGLGGLVLSLLFYGVLQGWIYRDDFKNWGFIALLVGCAALIRLLKAKWDGPQISKRSTRISIKSKHQMNGSRLMVVDVIAHIWVLTAFYYALLPRVKFWAHFNSLYHEWIPVEDGPNLLLFILIGGGALMGLLLKIEEDAHLNFGEPYKLRLSEKWGEDFWPRSLKKGDLLEVVETKDWKGQTIKDGTNVIHSLLWNGHVVREIPLHEDGLMIGKNGDEKKIPRFARIVSIHNTEFELMFEFIDERAVPFGSERLD